MPPDEAEEQSQSGEGPWRGTVFDAALDAADGLPWDRVSPGGSDTWWGTQVRLLMLCMDLVGVNPDLSAELRHQLGELHGVDTMTLELCAKEVVRSPGYRSRGQAVATVLGRIPTRSALRRILAAGHLTGRWGRPLWWDGEVGVMRSWAFPTSGTDPP